MSFYAELYARSAEDAQRAVNGDSTLPQSVKDFIVAALASSPISPSTIWHVKAQGHTSPAGAAYGGDSNATIVVEQFSCVSYPEAPVPVAEQPEEKAAVEVGAAATAEVQQSAEVEQPATEPPADPAPLDPSADAGATL